jgi:glucose dehydrogenase
MGDIERFSGILACRMGSAALICLCLTAPAVNARDAGASKPFDFKTWDQYLGGGDSSQYSSLTQIDKSNVSKLEIAWTYETGPGPAPNFNPTIVGRVMYVLGPKNAIVALDAATGKEIWSHPNQGLVGNRGINQWVSKDGKDRRLFYINNGMLTALDAATGETVTSFGENGRVDLRVGLDRDITDLRPLQTANPGRIYKDLIIVSLPAGGGFGYGGTPADIHAYDVRTGGLKWVFHTIPATGEFGADTLPHNGRSWLGGAHNWSESTIDEKRGIIYIPTGTLRYDFYGGDRPGDNLFANSLIALDAMTGKRLWHFQFVHHDLWDYDTPEAPKLLTVVHNGKKIDAVAQATKTGFLFVFDRVTGKPLWPIEERQVPKSDTPGEHASPTQPFPTLPPPFERQKISAEDLNPYLSDEGKEKAKEIFATARYGTIFTPPSVQGTIALPGHQGGANWGGSAVDPKRGEMFVVSRALPTFERLVGPEPGSKRPTPPSPPEGFVPYSSPVDFLRVGPEGMTIIGPPWSQLTAYDLNKGTIKWHIPLGGMTALEEKGISGTGGLLPRGGPALTAGGLIFVGTTTDRKLHVYAQDTGELLWERQFDGACEGIPAVYEIDGREFVAVTVGGNGMFGMRGAAKPGPNRYVVFALPKT